MQRRSSAAERVAGPDQSSHTQDQIDGLRAALAKYDGWVRLHAATLDSPAGRVLLVGASGAGKTTLALGLRARGWRCLGDELALLGPDGSTVAWSRDLKLYRSRDHRDSAGWLRDPQQTPEAWVEPVCARPGPAPLRGIVVLAPGGGPRIRALTVGEALALVWPETGSGGLSPEFQTQFRVLSAVLPGVVRLRLYTGAPAETVDRLAGALVDALESGRVGY